MQAAMYSQLLLIAIGLLAMAIVRLLREPGRYGSGYLYVLLAGAALTLVGTGEGQQPWGIAGVALAVITVVLPFVLDILGRSLWEGSSLALACALAHLRGHLLLGGGARLQAEIWSALARFPNEGAAASVSALRGLKREWGAAAARAMIDEQIFAVFAIDGQWDLAIESQLASRDGVGESQRLSAALRMRAYLEQGRWELAKNLLFDAQSSAIVSPYSIRAQWVFLAMGGHPSIEAMAKDPALRARLGMSDAVGSFWRALYHRARGEFGQARQALEESKAQATPQKQFHLHMVQRLGEAMQEPAKSWPDELRSELSSALPHFEEELARAPRWGTGRAPLLVLGLVLGSLARLLVVLHDGGAADALLKWGLLSPEIWANGGYFRVLSAPFLCADFFAWVLISYLWWLSGFHGPSRFGALRWLGALLLSPVLSLLLMAQIAPAFAGAGASSVALVAAICTALWSGPNGLSLRGRSKLWTAVVGLLLLLKFAAALMDPAGGPFGAMAMLVCAVFAILALMPWRAPGRGSSASAGALLVVWILSWPLVLLGPPLPELLEAQSLHCRAQGVDWQLPPRFRRPSPTFAQTMPIPELEGWVDSGAWQGRAWVQLGVVSRPAGLAPEELSIFAQWPKLRRAFSVSAPSFALPPALRHQMELQGPSLRALELRQNGQALALVVERDLPTSSAEEDAQAQSVVLIWQPRRPSKHYFPSQLQALLGAGRSEGSLAPCPGPIAEPQVR